MMLPHDVIKRLSNAKLKKLKNGVKPEPYMWKMIKNHRPKKRARKKDFHHRDNIPFCYMLFYTRNRFVKGKRVIITGIIYHSATCYLVLEIHLSFWINSVSGLIFIFKLLLILRLKLKYCK